MHLENNFQTLADTLAGYFSKQPQVEAITLGGSTAAKMYDSSSDIDLYIYTLAEIPLTERVEIVHLSGGASISNLGLTYWGPGDEWFHLGTGIEIDIIYFDRQWMDDQIQRVIDHCHASLGYSTCIWHIVKISQIQYDPNGWFEKLQRKTQTSYPDLLQENIIRLNYPVLRSIIPSYAKQLEKAANRGDLVSVNHRLAALFASYFDIIFAINRVLHPGEKRLLHQAGNMCKKLPEQMEADITSVIRLSCLDGCAFLHQLNAMLDHLDTLLEQEGFLHFFNEV